MLFFSLEIFSGLIQIYHVLGEVDLRKFDFKGTWKIGVGFRGQDDSAIEFSKGPDDVVFLITEESTVAYWKILLHRSVSKQ